MYKRQAIHGEDDSAEVERKARALDFSLIVPQLVIKPIKNPLLVERKHPEPNACLLYTSLGMENMKCYFISADEQFELAYGRRADKKRKLYNGNIQCTFCLLYTSRCV